MKTFQYMGIVIFFISTTISIAQIKNIDKYISPLVENQDFSGVVLIAENDSIVHLKGYGYADLEWNIKNTENSVFHIASLTKQFTAAALLIAEQKEMLSIQDKVSKYLKDFPNGDKITLEHLLSQRSGIPDYNDLKGYSEMAMKESSLMEVIDWFKAEPLQFPPGSKYGYSNSNFALAAKILEIACGKSFSEFLQEFIFMPLDMGQTGNYSFKEIVPFRTTGYDPAPEGLEKAPYYNKSFKMGSGSLYSSAMDLLKWDKALYGNEVLTLKSKEKLFKDYGDNYGLGWGIYNNDDVGKFIAHDGKSPGYFSYMKRYIENEPKISIIILSNINAGVMNSMKTDITNIVFNKDFTQYESYTIAPTPNNLREYVGKYDFPPDFHYSIVEKDGDLYFKWMDTDFLQYLTPIAKDKFIMRSRYDYLTFKRDEKTDTIIGIDYKQKGGKTFCPVF